MQKAQGWVVFCAKFFEKLDCVKRKAESEMIRLFLWLNFLQITWRNLSESAARRLMKSG